VILVLYGALTEQNVAALFAAGFLPGILGILLYIAAIAIATKINPALGPRAERANWSQRFRALTGVWGVLILFTLVMGGIYLGVFTPTEAAGIGAGGAFLIAALRGTLTVRTTFDVLIDAARTTAMMFTVLIGALIFANFINMARLPNIIADWVQGLDATPIMVIFVILAIYVVLGCILESLSMMLLTVPLFYPMVGALGFDLVWFGIFVVVAIEISLITPPIGLNIFVLKAMLPDVDTGTMFRGVVPFIVADFFRLAILIFFPGLVLFLPRLIE
jgi:tripartite ATP-independent transporter DctM subunit